MKRLPKFITSVGSKGAQHSSKLSAPALITIKATRTIFLYTTAKFGQPSSGLYKCHYSQEYAFLQNGRNVFTDENFPLEA